MKSIYMMRRKTATTLEIKGVVAVFFKIRRGGGDSDGDGDSGGDGHIDDVASALIALKRKNKRRTATLSATVPLL